MAKFPDSITVDVGLDDSEEPEAVRALVARKLRVAEEDLPALELKKRSLDARGGAVRFHLLLEPAEERAHELAAPHPRPVTDPARVVIIGAGPAGLFCAYELARHGIGSTVLDRGKPVQPRRRDLKALNRRGEVDSDSNYCFGEGGAGTYSDGKLYTRSHKRGSVRDVIEILVRHGAPPAILTDARPHIGSNKLPKVVSSIREELERAGVVFRFGARVGQVAIGGSPARRALGVRLAEGAELAAEHVVLATGHSAADVYASLEAAGVALSPKPFALGVRVEHPQPLINRIQYRAAAGHPKLPAAAYRLAATVEGRGVFSFCMCPGGWVVPAATEPGGLVVNGMSLSKRNSPYANSGLVVQVTPEDVAALGFSGPLGGIVLQHTLEQRAFEAGGGSLRAPATRATDFLKGRASTTVPKSSYIPGLTAGDVAAVVDAAGLRVAERLRRALRDFDRRMRGYATEEAVLIGVETRTSSPVRIERDAATFEAIGVARLYPAGEGAGYAGGIMSAALDGINVARRIAACAGAAR